MTGGQNQPENLGTKTVFFFNLFLITRQKYTAKIYTYWVYGISIDYSIHVFFLLPLLGIQWHRRNVSCVVQLQAARPSMAAWARWRFSQCFIMNPQIYTAYLCIFYILLHCKAPFFEYSPPVSLRILVGLGAKGYLLLLPFRGGATVESN